MNASSDNSAAIVKPAQASVIRFANPKGLSIAGGTTGQSAPLVTVNIHRSIEEMAALVSATRDGVCLTQANPE